MSKLILFFCGIFFSGTLVSQELNCTIKVLATQTGQENNTVFKNLEKQIREFVNNSRWTDLEVSQEERIKCNMTLNILDYQNDQFSGTLQIQASRPVYNSNYLTPLYNFHDQKVAFQYQEFQNLIFNKNQFESNLVSLLSFHIYMILALDADSFEPQGGSAYLNQAQTILTYSQSSKYSGWNLKDGNQTRFEMISNLVSANFKEYRSVMYDYHRLGLDTMSQDSKSAKENIEQAIDGLYPMYKRRPNSFVLRIFFDAKTDEIVKIFSGGPKVNTAGLIDKLNKMAPQKSAQWQKIKY